MTIDMYSDRPRIVGFSLDLAATSTNKMNEQYESFMSQSTTSYDTMSDSGRVSSFEASEMKYKHTDIADFERWQANIGLKTFGEGLQAAAKAIFPAVDQPHDTKTYVLMTYWADNDDDVAPLEVSRLFGVFKDIFHFEVQMFRIPREDAQDIVNRKISDFVKLGGDSDEDLKIMFYAGDAQVNQNNRLVWRYVKRDCAFTSKG